MNVTHVIAVSTVVVACSTSTQPPADAPVDIPAVELSHDAWHTPPLQPLATAPECPAVDPPPCVVEVVSLADPAQVGYRICCPQPGRKLGALKVDSTAGPWGDDYGWKLCGHGYVVEFTHPMRTRAIPWAVLDTYPLGGPIDQCKTENAP